MYPTYLRLPTLPERPIVTVIPNYCITSKSLCLLEFRMSHELCLRKYMGRGPSPLRKPSLLKKTQHCSLRSRKGRRTACALLCLILLVAPIDLLTVEIAPVRVMRRVWMHCLSSRTTFLPGGLWQLVLARLVSSPGSIMEPSKEPVERT